MASHYRTRTKIRNKLPGWLKWLASKPENCGKHEMRITSKGYSSARIRTCVHCEFSETLTETPASNRTTGRSRGLYVAGR